MRYASIRKQDIQNGPGIRISIFVQGCHFHCKNCFNSETWPFDGGKEFTNEEMDLLMKLGQPDYIKGLSILGGEPMAPENIGGVKEIAKRFKELYPTKTVWVWSGYLFENIIDKDIFNYIDVLIDGQFKDELKDFRLKYRGSANQRVIDIKKSIDSNRIIEIV